MCEMGDGCFVGFIGGYDWWVRKWSGWGDVDDCFFVCCVYEVECYLYV